MLRGQDWSVRSRVFQLVYIILIYWSTTLYIGYVQAFYIYYCTLTLQWKYTNSVTRTVCQYIKINIYTIIAAYNIPDVSMGTQYTIVYSIICPFFLSNIMCSMDSRVHNTVSEWNKMLSAAVCRENSNNNNNNEQTENNHIHINIYIVYV